MHWTVQSKTQRQYCYKGCSNVVISIPHNWCHRHLNLQYYNDISILVINSAMMSYTFETVNLLHFCFICSRSNICSFNRAPAPLLAISSQNAAYLTIRLVWLLIIGDNEFTSTGSLMSISLLQLCQRYILLLILACGKIFELVTRCPLWDTVHPCNLEIDPGSLCYSIQFTCKLFQNLSPSSLKSCSKLPHHCTWLDVAGLTLISYFWGAASQQKNPKKKKQKKILFFCCTDGKSTVVKQENNPSTPKSQPSNS